MVHRPSCYESGSPIAGHWIACRPFRHRLRCLVAWAVLAMLLMVGCQPSPPSTASAPAVVIGAIYPFSGPSADSGKEIRDAVEMAVEMVNTARDLPLPMAEFAGLHRHGGAPIRVVFADSEGDEAIAGRRVVELVNKHHVVALMGCYNSTVTAAASEQAEVLRIPFLNATSTSPVLTQRGLLWFFRTTPDDAAFAENFFDFFEALTGQGVSPVPHRLALVYENRLWGTSVAMAERKLAARFGYQVTADVPYDAKTQDVSRELAQIAGGMPGIILQASYADDAIRFMTGYRALNIQPTAIVAMNAGFTSPHFLATLGQGGEYVFSREVWALDLADKKPLVGRINDLFRQRTGRNMSGTSARAFTGLIVLADAINRAETLSADAIRGALRQTHFGAHQVVMPWGGVSFDPETGQNTLGNGIIVQVQEGMYHTVWPKELANRSAVWPMPAWPAGGDGGANE
ncbi:MAG: ABC transporter substrate-binding protein [Pseudomonadota bacterium]